jgi:hypothetical protein
MLDRSRWALRNHSHDDLDGILKFLFFANERAEVYTEEKKSFFAFSRIDALRIPCFPRLDRDKN